MQIVIDIPDDVYDECKGGDVYFPDTGAVVWEGVRNGIPLPKGHGELKDVNEIWRLYDYTDIDYTMIDALNDAPTIIEADKESKY